LSAGAYEFAEVHDQVLEICRAESIPCVDLRSTFVPYRDYVSLWVNRFDPHPNVLAHRLAAERIEEILGSLWLDTGAASGAASPDTRRPVPIESTVPGGSAARRHRAPARRPARPTAIPTPRLLPAR
jgi:hypothetical protein